MELNMFADFTDRLTLEKRLELIGANGFDGVMLGFLEENKHTQFEAADKAGLKIENVHSPFDRMNALWQRRDDSEEILRRTVECIKISAANGIKKVIVHPTDGLVPPEKSNFGIANFDRIVDKAVGLGVQVLFENIQLPEFLDVLFEHFAGCESVGFCYDIGHENCFTKGDDRLAKHGGLLRALHIHDNDGKSDGHMIPFDGIIDYTPFLKKLKAFDYKSPMSLELYMNKSRAYENMPCQAFAEKAYQAGRALIEQFEEMKNE